ncbi:MAG: DUF1345 domain-containing protein [Micrococcales bacterium]|nr:DUF1345 domain-containing protein [Micrococcales bacterium]
MTQRISKALDTPVGVRIAVAAVVGVLVGALLTWTSGAAAALGGWAATGLVFVVWTMLVIAPMDAEATAEHARREEPTRGAGHTLVLLAGLASLAGVAVVLAGGGLAHHAVTSLAVLSAVVASWATAHTVFALRYARMYYAAPAGGVDFHQSEPPCYTDFTYMAVTVGMSFAISDTDLAASSFRRTAQVQALLAYLFGTVIVALLVNLVASLAS